MKLSKALLGAILIGVSVQTTSCEINEEDLPQPSSNPQLDEEHNGEIFIPENCIACGMG